MAWKIRVRLSFTWRTGLCTRDDNDGASSEAAVDEEESENAVEANDDQDGGEAPADTPTVEAGSGVDASRRRRPKVAKVPKAPNPKTFCIEPSKMADVLAKELVDLGYLGGCFAAQGGRGDGVSRLLHRGARRSLPPVCAGCPRAIPDPAA